MSNLSIPSLWCRGVARISVGLEQSAAENFKPVLGVLRNPLRFPEGDSRLVDVEGLTNGPVGAVMGNELVVSHDRSKAYQTADVKHGKRCMHDNLFHPLKGTAMKPVPDPLGMGHRIKEARQEMGLTQTALAKRLNCSKAVVSQWESGQVKDIRLERFFELADALDVIPRWLAVGIGHKRGVSMARDNSFEVLALARRLLDMPPERLEMLLALFQPAAPDSALPEAFKAPPAPPKAP